MSYKGKWKDEYEEIVLSHIRHTGQVKGCTDPLPVALTEKTVRNHVSLEKIEEALKIYKATRPDINPELVIASDEKLTQMAKNGYVRIQEDVDPKTNEVLTRRIIRSPNIPKWVYEKIHPARTITEQAIVVVVSNQYKDIADAEDLDATIRKAIMDWLSDWMRRAIEELQMRGLSTKYLEENIT